MHARPRVLTPSVLLGLTVKIETIGAVICSASRRTSADRRQSVRFGHSTVRLWCSEHLQLCLCARVDVLPIANDPSIDDIDCIFFFFLVELCAFLRSVIRIAACAIFRFPRRYPLHVTLHNPKLKLSSRYRPLRLYAVYARVDVFRPPISGQCCLSNSSLPLRKKVAASASVRFTSPRYPQPYITIQDPCTPRVDLYKCIPNS